MTLGELNQLEASLAQAEFARCCGSSRWAVAMSVARPFATLDAMQNTGDALWASLGRSDWLDAFSAHPKIGEQGPVSAWSVAEQSGMQSAGDAVKARLSVLNLEYERRFGYIFIVCATGKSSSEMLALLDARLGNTPDNELSVAAEEQRKITRLRLARLVDANA